MKYLTAIFLLISLSCIGIIDESKFIPITKISEQQVIGKWRADTNTYKIDNYDIENNNQPLKDSLEITLNEDHTFTLENGMFIKNDSMFQADFKGTWKLERNTQKGHKNMLIQYYFDNEIVNAPEYLTAGMSLYNGKNGIVQIGFIDDPDMAQTVNLYKE